jgi:methylamine dehydrogenase accessory protein MauD
MTEALVVSNLVLWALVVALALVVVALTRQIGVLHERIAPVGALAVRRGPSVGDATPEMWLPDLHGRRVRVGGADALGRRTLIFFLSPTCPVCKTLLPTLARVLAEQSESVRLVHASDGPSEDHRRFVRERGLEEVEYVLSESLGLHFAVSKLPYAVLLDGAGVIRAMGIVNTREHVESLFEADRLGVGTLQDFLGRGAGSEPRPEADRDPHDGDAVRLAPVSTGGRS